ncbi:hypothetical protein [Curvibacter sp. PAE-UM]|uniref:hypothetical protein n=1 Tax=Curvibacter sp. PAE-UM TaxID=1714344 RepID=UPI0007093D1F|nr:hypothetical protein [Curvibacter sp. PAE-UM]KRH99008.1 hypothetical protein AO057_05970 [Curvibacter sp. PAE-UM]
MRRPELGAGLALLLAILALPAQAEYCVNYSSRVMSLARQAGSMNTRGCVATESQCNSARMSRPGDYSGICYYVPGMYPPTPGKSGGGAPPGDQGAKANAEAQKKIRAQQQAQDQADQRAAQQTRQDLLGGLKGVEPSSTGLTIKLPAAPVGGTARAQLDCVTRASASSSREDAARLGPGVPVQGGQDDFENAEDCRPVATPGVPEASPPVPVAEELPRDPALLARLLASLLARQREMQQQLASQDRDIARREAELAREEQAPKVDLKTAPAESDALRRAREALAKARADRQKTAAEYEKLQQQAQQARQQQSAP